MNDEERAHLTRRGLLHASATLGAGLIVQGCRSAHDAHAGHEGHAWAERLDDPARDAWQRPDEVVAALALTEGMVVADVGAGTGYFERHLARAVGERGRVLAIDVDPDLVARMRARFEAAGLRNVEARLAATDDPGLERVDRVLVVDVWHHLEGRAAYAAKLARALAPSGRIVVVDYPPDAEHGPPAAMRVGPEVVVAELEAAGLAARVAPVALPRQYVVIGEARR